MPGNREFLKGKNDTTQMCLSYSYDFLCLKEVKFVHKVNGRIIVLKDIKYKEKNWMFSEAFGSTTTWILMGKEGDIRFFEVPEWMMILSTTAPEWWFGKSAVCQAALGCHPWVGIWCSLSGWRLYSCTESLVQCHAQGVIISRAWGSSPEWSCSAMKVFIKTTSSWQGSSMPHQAAQYRYAHMIPRQVCNEMLSH